MALDDLKFSPDRRGSGSDVSDEKQIGITTVIDPADIDAPTILDAAHAVEYVEFMELKKQFEEDPKAYKALIRKRKIIWPQFVWHRVADNISMQWI